jgi:hypothetical protein
VVDDTDIPQVRVLAEVLGKVKFGLGWVNHVVDLKTLDQIGRAAAEISVEAQDLVVCVS